MILVTPLSVWITIRKKLGETEARRIANKFAGEIQNTNNWQEEINPNDEYDSVDDYLKQGGKLDQLYFQAYPYLDDADEVARLGRAGFDGAILAGSGATAKRGGIPGLQPRSGQDRYWSYTEKE